MVRQLIFGGIRTADYKAIVDGSGTYIAPERDYETVTIPGRNGELTIDNGRYTNVELVYTIRFRTTKYADEFRSRVMPLTGYRRLEDNKRPDEYRMARLSTLTPTISGVENRYAILELAFNAMAQRYLKSGEQPITVTSGMTLNNPWGVAAQPILRITGTGAVTVGDNTLTIAPHPKSYVEIDCEMGDAYCEGENLNKYVTRGAGFPILMPGETKITVAETITKLELFPRWWRL